MRHFPYFFWIVAIAMLATMILSGPAPLWADGMVLAPAKRDYKGSLEERAQEAIVIFNSSPPQREATEDLILKIRVEGETSPAQVSRLGRPLLPDGGKNWTLPMCDPFLRDAASRIKTVARLFQELHPYQRYYLTNIAAFGLKPAEVRKWKDDLWLFPYYRDKNRVPFDAQPGGPAAAAYAR